MNALKYMALAFGNGGASMNYLVHWAKNRNYVYVETPKAACTSIKRVLQEDQTGIAPGRNLHDRAASPLPRISDDILAFKTLYENENTFRFCFVRNPYTRILSTYLDKIVTNEWERNRMAPKLNFKNDEILTFEDFLLRVKKQPERKRDIHWATQTYLLRPSLINYSFIGRFESFNKDFDVVKSAIGIDISTSANGAWHATGAASRMSEFLTPKSISLIRSIYKDDFKNFAYGLSTTAI